MKRKSIAIILALALVCVMTGCQKESAQQSGVSLEYAEGENANTIIKPQMGDESLTSEDLGSTSSSYPEPEEDAKTLADLCLGSTPPDNYILREKIDFSHIKTVLDGITSWKEALNLYSNYGDNEEVEVSSADTFESTIKQVCDANPDSYSNPNGYTAIRIVGDVSLTPDNFTLSDGLSDSASLRGLSLIVSSGATLTLNGLKVNGSTDARSTGCMPVIEVENGGKLRIEDKSNVYLSYSHCLLVDEGGEVEVENGSSLDSYGIINKGKITITTPDVSDYESRAGFSAYFFFYNDSTGIFTMNDAWGSIYDSSEWGEFYDSEEYGTPSEWNSSFFWNNPRYYNLGTLVLNGNYETGLDFYNQLSDDEIPNERPFINDGLIEIVGVGRHQFSVDGHFQNYGTIKITGQMDVDRWGNSEEPIDAYGGFIENYGTIDCSACNTNAININGGVFINYEGANFIEVPNKKYATIQYQNYDTAQYYDHVVPNR